MAGMITDMSKKVCAECGKVLDPNEIRINERRFRLGTSRKRYLCLSCRQKEYDLYTNSIKKLIEKNEKFSRLIHIVLGPLYLSFRFAGSRPL